MYNVISKAFTLLTHTRQFSLQVATHWRSIASLQGRLPRVTPHACVKLVSQRKIAWQVAEKVEAASTFHNATRQFSCSV